MVALGFTDSGFVGVAGDGFRCRRWAGLVDSVLGCGFCAVDLSGLRGGSWWVSVGGLARSGSGWVAGCFLVGLWGGSWWLTVVEQLTGCLRWL
uniref:Uncharacterized protein n=1 Tax=Fagus sylvatica TaxID=28930 RepID=A0A2N9I4H0_FAGSY